MPTWEVTEHRAYILTFTVDAPTRDAAIAAAGALPGASGEYVEGGLDHVEARCLDTPDAAPTAIYVVRNAEREILGAYATEADAHAGIRQTVRDSVGHAAPEGSRAWHALHNGYTVLQLPLVPSATQEDRC